MNIVVCIKQVPDTAEVKINPETNTLIRDGVENIMNPFDRQALETALILKDTSGAKVTVVSMGPPQATDILKEAIAMGADDAVLISDRALAGSDTLATSVALAAAVRKVESAIWFYAVNRQLMVILLKLDLKWPNILAFHRLPGL